MGLLERAQRWFRPVSRSGRAASRRPLSGRRSVSSPGYGSHHADVVGGEARATVYSPTRLARSAGRRTETRFLTVPRSVRDRYRWRPLVGGQGTRGSNATRACSRRRDSALFGSRWERSIHSRSSRSPARRSSRVHDHSDRQWTVVVDATIEWGPSRRGEMVTSSNCSPGQIRTAKARILSLSGPESARIFAARGFTRGRSSPGRIRTAVMGSKGHMIGHYTTGLLGSPTG